MNLFLSLLGFTVLCSAILVEGEPNSDKVKIIIPHKISYIHHHHHNPSKDLLRKRKKGFYKTNLKMRDIYESTDVDGEGDDEIESEEEIDNDESESLYYAIPAAELSRNGNDLSVKPVLLYKSDRPRDSKHFKREKLSESVQSPVFYGRFHGPRHPFDLSEESLISQKYFSPQKREKSYKYSFRL